MAKVTTTSMEAYRNFLEGQKKFDKQYFNEARLYFENAVELDSTFATAHLLLVFTYGNLRDIEKEQASLDKAILYADKVSEKERLKIEEMVAVYRENDPNKRIQILGQLVERYPFEKDARYSLAWYYYYDKYMYDDALEQYQNLLSLDPEFSIALRDVANIYLELRNFEKAIEYTDKYLKCDPNNASVQDILAKMHFYRGEYSKSIEKFKYSLKIKPDFKSDIWIAYTYALLGNFPEALNHLDSYIAITPTPGLKAQGYWFKGFIQCWSGQFKDSDVNFQHAWELWKSGGNEYGLAVIKMTQAYGYLSRGRYEQSRQSIEKWAEYESKNSGDPGGAHLVLCIIHCQQGDLDSARYRLEQVRELAPRRKNTNEAEARLVEHIYTGMKAEVFMAEGAFEKAITEGEKNKHTVIPRFGLRQFVAFNIPFLKDYLPRAFELKGDTVRAIQEYEFLISVDQGKERFRLIHPIYYYRLAILYEKTEQYDKALDTYNRFLKLWKNADKDLPELMDAKGKVEELSKHIQAV
jgi:tetratricopeptide (TPR) repeat protein